MTAKAICTAPGNKCVKATQESYVYVCGTCPYSTRVSEPIVVERYLVHESKLVRQLNADYLQMAEAFDNAIAAYQELAEKYRELLDFSIALAKPLGTVTDEHVVVRPYARRKPKRKTTVPSVEICQDSTGDTDGTVSTPEGHSRPLGSELEASGAESGTEKLSDGGMPPWYCEADPASEEW